jgi:hypothetical protein
VSAPQVTWYADHKRAVVDDHDGRKWWLAPNAGGDYDAICDDPCQVRTAESLDAALTLLLGNTADLYRGVGR